VEVPQRIVGTCAISKIGVERLDLATPNRVAKLIRRRGTVSADLGLSRRSSDDRPIDQELDGFIVAHAAGMEANVDEDTNATQQ
jgi:hypothetical protein